MKLCHMLVAVSLVSVAADANAALKTRTKSNNANERAATTSAAPVASEEVSLLWGDGQPTEVPVVRAIATPAAGSEFSFGASNSSGALSSGMSSGKASHSDLSVMKRSTGPGTMSISFKGDSSGVCPVTYDAVKPIPGIGVVVKKNPGGSSERHNFIDVTVTKCDGSGVTFSYIKAGWDVKTTKIS